jgi:hypothetical protein
VNDFGDFVFWEFFAENSELNFWGSTKPNNPASIDIYLSLA